MSGLRKLKIAADCSCESQTVGRSSVKMVVKLGSGILVKRDSTSQVVRWMLDFWRWGWELMVERSCRFSSNIADRDNDEWVTVVRVASSRCVYSRSFLDNLTEEEQVSEIIGRDLG
jgi:hypothetical protein